MSIYAYLNYHDCEQNLWLGKALHDNYRPFAFHIGDSSEPSNWERRELNKIMWKFLADHTGHRVDVRLEHDMSDEMYDYQTIGGDSDNDISEAEYLKHEYYDK